MAVVLERRKIEVRPTGAALGADIQGVDLAQKLAPEAVDAIKQAWADHLVLRFRGQRLDDDQLMRFSAQFGELDWAPVIAASRVKILGEDRYVESAEEGRRYISVISNIVENGKAIGALGAYESIWHTDMSYNPEPPCASALYARPTLGRLHRLRQHVSRLRNLARGIAAGRRRAALSTRCEP